jgi:hypothetical protein
LNALISPGQRVDDLHLVGLAEVAEALQGLLAADLLALERLLGVDDLLHLGLDEREIVVGERPVDVEVVEEAGLDRRADRHLRLRKQPLDRLGHHVRGRVAQRLQRRQGRRRADHALQQLLLDRLVPGALPARGHVRHVRHQAGILRRFPCRVQPSARRERPAIATSTRPRNDNRAPRGARCLFYFVGTGGFEPPTPTVSR